MKVSAKIESALNQLGASVSTNDVSQPVGISVKSSGMGSAVNGGELLMLSLATCFCNDIFREAKRKNIIVNSVSVECSSVFDKEGEAGSDIFYKVHVDSPASPEDIDDLIAHTDKVAEIHNTLRKGVSVTLTR